MATIARIDLTQLEEMRKKGDWKNKEKLKKMRKKRDRKNKEKLKKNKGYLEI